MVNVTDGVAMLEPAQIVPSEVALRSVDKNSPEFLQLAQSVARNGILTPILVTSQGDGMYSLVDGLHRFTAAKEMGLTSIPVQVKTLDDVQMMEAQIIANLHKVETKPMDYTRQLYRLMMANPMMTMGDLAERVSQTSSWLSTRLSLQNLSKPIQDLVNEGQINLSNAYALAKLPEEEQGDFVDRAQTDSPNTFVPTVSARVKEIRDANKAGRAAAPATFQPIIKVLSKATIEAEITNPTVAATVLASEGATTLEEAFVAGLKWVTTLHKEGIKAQEEAYNTRKAQREAAQAEAKAAREAAKKEAAARQAADISKL